MAERSKSMDALYRNIKAVWPGVVIGWIGDPAHAARVSGHNPDDTPGVRAELADSDSLQEVRSLDVMFGPAFGARDAQALVRALISQPSRPRLFYVIHNGSSWGKPYWNEENYDGDPHATHVHVSGWVDDDENRADWPAVLALRGPMAIDKHAVHTFLKDVLAATDPDGPVERQIRDMIRGGDHSPFPDHRGLLSGLATKTEVNALAQTHAALTDALADLANQIQLLKTAIGLMEPGTLPSAAEIAREFGTRLSAE